MVMHARKISRFNDGYYERNQTHPFEEKYPSKSHGGGGYNDRFSDRSRESPNFSRGRDDSPTSRPSPRYQNKSSYIDRAKDRMDKGSSSSPGDRRINNYPSSSASSSRSFDSDRHSNHDKAIKDGRDNQKEKDPRVEIQKTAIQLCGDWSEHLSSSGKKYYYNCKTEVSQWEKPREWLDSATVPVRSDQRNKDRNGRDRQPIQVLGSSKSSEERYKHSSSSDHRPVERERCLKAITTVSTPQRASLDRNYPSTSTTINTTLGHEIRNRQGISTSNYHGGDLSNHASTSTSSSSNYGYGRSSEHSHHKSWDYRDRERDSHSSRGRDSSSYRTESSYSHDRERDRERDRYDRGRDYDGHHRTNYSAAAGSASMSTHNGARSSDSYRADHEDSREAEDMDISPGSTPTSSRSNSRPQSRQGTPHVPASSTPVSVTTPTAVNALTPLGPKPGGAPCANHNAETADFTKQAIETLQRLQQALLAQQAQQLQQQRIQLHQQRQQQAAAAAAAAAAQQQQQASQANAHGHASPASDATPPYTEPSPKKSTCHSSTIGSHRSSHGDDHHHHHHHRKGSREAGGESPKSDRSVRSSRHGSPTPSQSSSQSMSLSRRVSASGPKKQESVLLTPSLANYVNERLTEHVSGWQADHVERQTSRYTEEAITVGSLHCTSVSAELKKGRSLVRIAEIQSTLHEQRILFLRQQIKELENMRSQNTYYQDT